MAKKPQKETELPKRLKKLRMQTGLSQKDFAKTVKLAYAQYNRYERGDNVPSTETLAKLADAFEISVDYLLEGEEKNAAIANMADQDLLRMFTEIEKFPSEEKDTIKDVLDAFITRHKVSAAVTK